MKRTIRSTTIALALTALLCMLTSAAWANQSEGQVLGVKDWTLTIKTASGEELSFNPYWVKEGNSFQPGKPSRTVLPALEQGERLRVTWTADEREKRRRIDGIDILSPKDGRTQGVVISASKTELVIRPKEKTGRVTLNTKYVQVEGKWVPDPAISETLAKLTKEARVEVKWHWDQEGRKRIDGILPIATPSRQVTER